MDVLIVDLIGKFACFRKFYTNSSSLTYSVPPRTVIEGIIAAALGYDRDSYYDKFEKMDLNIAVRKASKTKKIMQTLNYMKATNNGEILNPKEHTQIPTEIIVPDDKIIYRIYISCSDLSILDKIEYMSKNKKSCFPLYFGMAPFSCIMNFISRVKCDKANSTKEIPVTTLIRQEYIDDINIKESGRIVLTKEKMPYKFTGNRDISKAISYIYDENCSPLVVKLKCDFINLSYNNINENIVFM